MDKPSLPDSQKPSSTTSFDHNSNSNNSNNDNLRLITVDPSRSAGDALDSQLVPAKLPAVAADVSTVRRKRGRPAKGTVREPPLKKMRDEEDVCFICFDGGSLVLCDRR